MNCCDSFGACHQGPHCPVRQAGAACGSACAGSGKSNSLAQVLNTPPHHVKYRSALDVLYLGEVRDTETGGGSSNLKAAGAAVRRRPWLHIALALASFWAVVAVVAVVAMTALKT